MFFVLFFAAWFTEAPPAGLRRVKTVQEGRIENNKIALKIRHLNAAQSQQYCHTHSLKRGNNQSVMLTHIHTVM